ncbi:MAG: insulinase family protein [Oscillospiraceae bacterium]|nr:insulinase family protein [Oscillospiraceae bacterium]
MTMHKRIDENPFTGCRCTEVRHESGLIVRVCELPDFHTVSMKLCVRFGGLDLHYRTDGTEFHVLPGTAHFLEHQLFENKDINALSAFSKLGAEANACTDGISTVYEAHTAENPCEVLALLLKTVQEPAFTDKTVSKERGIIMSELRQAMDHPFFKAKLQMRQIRCPGHPECEDVLGNMKSLSEISRDMLMQAYSHWYTPNNMLLSCAGNITLEEVLETVDRVLERIPPRQTEALFPPVKLIPPQRSAVLRERHISAPLTAIEYACDLTGKPPEERYYSWMYSTLACDLIFGDMTEFEEEMLHSDMYSSAKQIYSSSTNFCTTVFLAVSVQDSEQYMNAVFCELENAKRKGLDAELFRIIMRSAYANACSKQGTPNNMAGLMYASWLDGFQPFDTVRLYHACRLSDIEKALPSLFPQEQCMRFDLLPDSSGEEEGEDGNV